MVNLRSCCLSCKLFWGYTITIDLDDMESNEDIVKVITKSLLGELTQLGLTELIETMDKKIKDNSFHIHRDFGNVLMTPDNEIIYVCDHK